MALVLAILGVTLALTAPAVTSFGMYKTQSDAEGLLTLLRDARGEAVRTGTVATVRLDPSTGEFLVDTTGVGGMGTYAAGSVDLGGATTLQTDLDRLQFVFQPTGAAFADSVGVHGAGGTVMVQVDPWSGVAYALAR
jgi:Tfp pilus assembly protein FimT